MFRRALIWLGVIALTAIAYLSGNTLLRDALPVLLTSFVAWLFARTLRAGRTPLIARAIAALDGPAWLADPAVAHYARRLTLLWATYLFLLASGVAALALHARYGTTSGTWTQAAQRFCAPGVPLAIAALFIGEFALRHRFLPQAPRHGFFAFVRDLIRHWPALLDEREVAGLSQNGDAGRTP
ncbi:MAG: hypothetical protein ACYC7G_10665 [Rudaea sp.]